MKILRMKIRLSTPGMCYWPAEYLLFQEWKIQIPKNKAVQLQWQLLRPVRL